MTQTEQAKFEGWAIVDVPAILSQHLAVLGKTGSGKTSTAKLAIEQVVATGARVCVLDPIKSDWWGLTSSRNGKQEGLPFHILGGPHGHVPLHASAGKAVAEIVANGQLPLSIIDMADFEPGGQSKFFVDFVPTLLRKMRGVVYLVLEEAHLFAPKERSGIGAENLSIHWAKTMATAGRSKGVRLVLVTQRTQALHNALLGSCDTLIAHRLTAPADQEPVVKWLKANTSRDVLERVSASLASLKTGEGWICSGEAKIFKAVQFDRIATYDNSATPTGDGAVLDVKTAAVDQDKLRAIIGQAIDQVKADDPRELRKRIAELERQVKATPAAAAPGPAKSVEVLTDADRTLLTTISTQLTVISERLVAPREFPEHRLVIAVNDALNAYNEEVRRAESADRAEFLKLVDGKRFEKIRQKVDRVAPVQGDRLPDAGEPGDTGSARVAAGLDAAQQKILDTLKMLVARGLTPNREMLARWLDIHPNGGRFNSNLAFLRTNGYLDGLRLTPKASINALPTGLAAAKSPLDGSQQQIIDVLNAASESVWSREQLAEKLGIHPNGGRYNSNLARLRTMGLIPERGPIALTEAAYR